MLLDKIKEIYDKMVAHQFVVSYKGGFNHELLKSLINLTEKKLDSIEENKMVKGKIFHFMIECVQTICKVDVDSTNNLGFLFLIGKKDENYIIHSGGVFKSYDSSMLIEQINYVNNLSGEEIREKYMLELKQKESTRNNVLLMSLLDISKRTKTKIDYSVSNLTNETDFISFKTVISK